MAYKTKIKKHKFDTEKKSEYSIYSNMRLQDSEGNEYSANPSDYFMMADNKKFEENYLVVTESNGGWSRTKIVKENPSKKDLISWNKKLKQHI